MRFLSCFLLITFLFAFSCTAPPAEEAVVDDTAQEEADIQAIKDLEAKWAAAANTGDIESIMSLLTDDVIMLSANEPIKEGKEAVRAAILADLEESALENTKVMVVEVRLAGDWAYARGTWGGTNIPKAGGESSQFVGKWIDIFERQPDGSWKVICNMYNSDLPVSESAD